MITTTQDYKNKINEVIRKTYGRVEIDYTDPFLDQSITVSQNENASVSYPNQVKDNIHDTYGKIASLDGSWILDGSWVSAPATSLDGQMGWWGKNPSGTGGVFAVPYPSLTVEFNERPIRQLKVIGDSSRQEYPVDFTVTMYDSAGVLKHTETVTNNTEVDFMHDYDPAPTEIAKMDLIISKWSHAGRQAKIIEFITSIQEVYEGDEIISINLLEEKEVSSGSLPIGNISSNEITIKLANTNNKFDVNNSASPLYQLLKQNRRIRAYVGTEDELIPLGQFWSGDWELPETSQYVVTTGNDRLHLLAQTTYSTSVLKQNVTLYDLAVDVFTDAGLSIEEYIISTDLHDYVVPYAYFAPMSHREALRQIASACLGQVYCDRNGVIRIEIVSPISPLTYPELTVDNDLYLQQEDVESLLDYELKDGYLFLTSEQMLTKDNYFKKNSPVQWSQITNIIEMQITTKTLDISQEILNTSLGIVGAGETKVFQIEYEKSPAKDVSVTSSSLIVTDTKFYSWGTILTIKNNGASEAEATIVLTGKPLIDGQTQKIIKQDQESIIDNGRISYMVPENPFFQSIAFGETLCGRLLNYYKNPQKDVDVDWRGDPSWELGDIAVVADNYTISPYSIVSQEIDFDGTLRSRLKGRNY